MRRIITIFLLAAGAYLPNAHAQTAAPKLFITWKARSFTPPAFSGKILPTANSQVTASVELIDNGKRIDLAAQGTVVYWYLNSEFLQGDKALQRITFRAPNTAGGTFDLLAEIPNYKPGIQLLKTISIPVVSPEAVIEAPFSSGIFSSANAELTGIPYFFNVADLSRLNFIWSVNDQAPTGAENPQKLVVKAGSGAAPGSTIEVGLTIRNSSNPSELGSKTITITYQP